VDCSRGGSNVLFVGVYGPDTPCDEVRGIKINRDKQTTKEWSSRTDNKILLKISINQIGQTDVIQNVCYF
jgi:hypothetical protein